MILLVKLLLAHFIGDFLLQPKSWVTAKEKKKLGAGQLYAHILVHGILVLLVLWDFTYWPMALVLMLVHGGIDVLKLYAQTAPTKVKWFMTDQALHLVSIVLLWNFWFQPVLELSLWIEDTVLWIYVTALLFLTFVAGITIQTLMVKWSSALKNSNEKSLHNAGKYIGMLERLFVFIFVVTGHWEAIGFLLAAKSVFRFGDLKESKDRKLTEYILIGTLLSFGIAISTALLVLELVSLL